VTHTQSEKKCKSVHELKSQKFQRGRVVNIRGWAGVVVLQEPQGAKPFWGEKRKGSPLSDSTSWETMEHRERGGTLGRLKKEKVNPVRSGGQITIHRRMTRSIQKKKFKEQNRPDETQVFRK